MSKRLRPGDAFVRKGNNMHGSDCIWVAISECVLMQVSGPATGWVVDAGSESLEAWLKVSAWLEQGFVKL